jgi:catechol 2,3-dioxygenase-like lactoylglutathione lyase family enzyme
MFDHVTIRVLDREASERFFDAVLTPLGIQHSYRGGSFSEWQDFSIAEATHAEPATHGLHVAFIAPSREQVDEFWRAGLASGLQDDGAPGPRPQYPADYYGAFLRDPGGNSIEAVHHEALRRRDGIVDHVWIRVADLAAATAFYRVVADAAGLEVREVGTESSTFGGAASSRGSFTLVPGEPTANLHMAFPGDEETVRRFHREALAAGYRDHGPPGERPQYHPGYYAAYVLDPDGNNIEVVDHHRPA